MSRVSSLPCIAALSVALVGPSNIHGVTLSQQSTQSELKGSPAKSLVVKDFTERFVLSMLQDSLPLWVQLSQIQLGKKCDILVTRLTQRVQEIFFDCEIRYKGVSFNLEPALENAPFEQTRLGYGTEAFQLTGIRLHQKKWSESPTVSARCLYQFDSAGRSYIEGANNCNNRMPAPLLRAKNQLQKERNSWRFHA